MTGIVGGGGGQIAVMNKTWISRSFGEYCVDHNPSPTHPNTRCFTPYHPCEASVGFDRTSVSFLYPGIELFRPILTNSLLIERSLLHEHQQEAGYHSPLDS